MAASKGLFDRRKFSFDLPSTTHTVGGLDVQSSTKGDIRKLNLVRGSVKSSQVDYQPELEEGSQVDTYMTGIRFVSPKSLVSLTRSSQGSYDRKEPKKTDFKFIKNPKVSSNIRLTFGATVEPASRADQQLQLKSQVVKHMQDQGFLKLIGPKTLLVCMKKPMPEGDSKQAPVPVLLSRLKSSDRFLSNSAVISKSKLPRPLSFYKPVDEDDNDIFPEPMKLKNIPPVLYAEESSYFDLTPKKQNDNESAEPSYKMQRRKVFGTHIQASDKLVTCAQIAPGLKSPPLYAEPANRLASQDRGLYTDKKIMIMRETSLAGRLLLDKSNTPKHLRDSLGAELSGFEEQSDVHNNPEENVSSKPQSQPMLLQVPNSGKSFQSLGQNSADASAQSASGRDESFMKQTGFSKVLMKKKVIAAAADVRSSVTQCDVPRLESLIKDILSWRKNK